VLNRFILIIFYGALDHHHISHHDDDVKDTNSLSTFSIHTFGPGCKRVLLHPMVVLSCSHPMASWSQKGTVVVCSFIFAYITTKPARNNRNNNNNQQERKEKEQLTQNIADTIMVDRVTNQPDDDDSFSCLHFFHQCFITYTSPSNLSVTTVATRLTWCWV
jgi:hypothetical protein